MYTLLVKKKYLQEKFKKKEKEPSIEKECLLTYSKVIEIFFYFFYLASECACVCGRVEVLQ